MKLLFVVPCLPSRGGAERVASVLTQYLQRTHDVTVASFDTSTSAYGYGGEIVDIGYPARKDALTKGLNAAARVAGLMRLLKRLNPDHIFTFMESASFPTILAAAATGHLARLSVSVQDNPRRFSTAYRALIRLLYRLPNRVVAVSEGVRRSLVHDFGLSPARCITIPNTISLETLHAELSRGLAEFTPPAERYIIAMGRLAPQKGFDRLIEVYSRLDKDAPPLFIFGEGPERQKLERLIKTHDLTTRITLPGTVHNPYPLLKNAECFVLSSRHEGWPLVLMETMACGCPIVAVDCDYGPKEILETEQSGLLVPQDDADQLTKALSRLLSDPDLRKRLSTNARTRVRAFSVETVSLEWLKL